jgi:hypothetical protein
MDKVTWRSLAGESNGKLNFVEELGVLEALGGVRCCCSSITSIGRDNLRGGKVGILVSYHSEVWWAVRTQRSGRQMSLTCIFSLG